MRPNWRPKNDDPRLSKLNCRNPTMYILLKVLVMTWITTATRASENVYAANSVSDMNRIRINPSPPSKTFDSALEENTCRIDFMTEYLCSVSF